MVESGRAEINESDFRISNEPEVLLLLVVVDLIERAVVEKNIFRLQIGVSEAVVVQKLDRVANLMGHLTHLLNGVWDVVVVLQEVEYGGSQHLEDDAHVAVIVEPIQHLHAAMLGAGVILCQLFKNVDLELCGLAILLNILDDFESKDFALSVVLHLDDLAERSLTERGDNFVAILYDVANVVNQVTLKKITKY